MFFYNFRTSVSSEFFRQELCIKKIIYRVKIKLMRLSCYVWYCEKIVWFCK